MILVRGVETTIIWNYRPGRDSRGTSSRGPVKPSKGEANTGSLSYRKPCKDWYQGSNSIRRVQEQPPFLSTRMTGSS
eukprot:6214132-Pleurochrysis_carterae.AAC.9